LQVATSFIRGTKGVATALTGARLWPPLRTAFALVEKFQRQPLIFGNHAMEYYRWAKQN